MKIENIADIADIADIAEEILKESDGYAKMAIQAPEGLKTHLLEVVDRLEECGKRVILFADPCYGACDLKDHEAKELGAELLVHIGHSEMGVEKELPVIFLPLFYDANDVKVDESCYRKLINAIGKRDFSIAYSINFMNVANEIADGLEDRGFKAGERVQVLGCSFSSNLKEEIVVYVGDGDFHPLGIALRAKKEVIAFNPFTKEIKDMASFKKKFLKQRYGVISIARHAKTFGIIVSTKKGQQNLKLATDVKKMLEKNGKKGYVLAMDRIEYGELIGYKVDVFVNTACPRIATDDLFEKPIINPDELEIALREGHET